nr:carbohydrate-binding domain-containing protein [uncultured Desulfuromonas sp.]
MKTTYRTLTFLFLSFFLTIILSACGGGGGSDSTTTSTSDTNTSSQDDTTTTDEDSAETVVIDESDVVSDEDWDDSLDTVITLLETTISVSGNGATVDGTTVTITAGGTYQITGSLDDGQIIVDSEDEETVRLVLDGIDVSCSTSSPLYIAGAELTSIILDDDSANYLTDASDYTFEDGDDEPDATLFSKDDLVISGSGSLTVTGLYNDAIKSKDGLVIEEATLFITSVDDGVIGKDYLVIRNANITADVEGDGLKSSEDEDEELGYVSIESGTFNLDCGADGIQAETQTIIDGGVFSITCAGGHTASLSDDDSAKGIKSGVGTTINDGTFTLNCADDAIHSDGFVTITGGTFTLATADDGIHADGTVTISGGDLTVTTSYEGVEGSSIAISDGDLHIVASDDGINVADGDDGSNDTNGTLTIDGGYIVVDADGDGIDVNGSIVMNDGTVLVNGPTSSGDSAIDYDRSFVINGGFLLAVGSANMAQAPGTSSTQNTVKVTLTSWQSAETLISLQTSAGNELFTFEPAKGYQSIVFSSPELSLNSSYNLYLGGNDSADDEDGLFDNGGYSGGSLYRTFTQSSRITSVR